MSILLSLALVAYGLARETDWQNAIRRAMGMPSAPAGLPVLIAIVSAPIALFLIGLTRLFNASAMLISARLAKLVPRRIALLVGFGIAAVLFWTLGNGLLLSAALHGLDSAYRRIDALVPAELSALEDPFESGSGSPLFRGPVWVRRGASAWLRFPPRVTSRRSSGAPRWSRYGSMLASTLPKLSHSAQSWRWRR